MDEESHYNTMGNSIVDDGNDSKRASATSSARSTLSARAITEDARLSRSPGIKILEMAGQAPVYQCKFSVKDFRLRNPAVPDDGSDEYDTDLESEEVGWIICL